jgi:hypothetical protein
MKKITILVFIFCLNGLYAQTWRQYNLQTAQITTVPFSYSSSASSDYKIGSQGIFPANFSSDTSRTFYPLDIVIDPNAYPWRTAVKFNNVSGILIDPYHVLTAGHAIEFHPYFKTVRFMPGYESNDNSVNCAFAEYFYLLSNYSMGTAYDYAIVKLDRPLGAFVGWNGYGYNNDNSFFQNNTFYNPCYPSTSPFSGEFLFNWKGVFDFAATEYLISSRNGYGGMSGSPAYTKVNGNNVVYGIVTNYGVKFNRLTSNKFDAINAVINLNTPAQFDLIPLNLKVSPKVVKQGNALESLSYILHNYSSENKNNANVTVSVYMSTDQQITTSDELIATYNIQDNYNSKSSQYITQTTSLPVINNAAGTYYIGIIVSGDNNTGNNTTGTVDVSQIIVTPLDFVTVSGRIVSTQTNNGVSGVNLNGFIFPVCTDINGYYETNVTSGWNGTVSLSKPGFDLSTSSTTYTNVTQNTTTNYTASRKTYTVSGYVKSPVAREPVKNAKLVGLIGEPFTDANGHYSVNVYHGWSGSVNFLKGNIWDFEPYNFNCIKVSSNINNNAYAGFHITGRCFENNGTPISDVVLQGFPIDVRTNTDGEYSAFIDSGWTGSVSPEKDGKLFIPENTNYENIYGSLDNQNYVEFKALTLNLKVLLGGAVHGNSDTMTTVLNYKNNLPLVPPDTLSGNGSPFVYVRKQNESITHKFLQYHRDIVDWIIIEIREFKDMTVPVDTIPAFVRRDGKVLSITGDSIITLSEAIPPDNYYIIIRHRNHLSIMSANPIFLTSDTYLYDFSEAIEQFYGYDAALLGNGKFGMYPGDADFNGTINLDDYQIYKNICLSAGTGYLSSDFNLDGNLTGTDFNTFAPINKKRPTTYVINSGMVNLLKARR